MFYECRNDDVLSLVPVRALQQNASLTSTERDQRVGVTGA